MNESNLAEGAAWAMDPTLAGAWPGSRRRPFTKTPGRLTRVLFGLMAASFAITFALGQSEGDLVGIWTSRGGFQTSTLLFRSSGRYQLDTSSNDPDYGLSSTERGYYQLQGSSLRLTPYDYVVRPTPKTYQIEQTSNSLLITDVTYGQSQTFQLQPNSKAEVLASERVAPILARVWRRHVPFYGDIECTFRPDGVYAVKEVPDNPLFAIRYTRGRYEQAGNRLTLKPYSDAKEVDEMDFFGNQLTVIETDSFSSQSATFDAVPGSEAEVQLKTAAAAAFLARTNWQVGVWEIRDGNEVVDLTLRPDGHYLSEVGTGPQKEVLRGRYLLESQQIRLLPFAGQDLYAHSGGDFGNTARIRQLDYYDGELQFIDLDSVIQWVRTARKRADSEALVMEKMRQAQIAQGQPEWWVGIWEVNDPAGWMQLTLRPDGRYLARAGLEDITKEVERGRFRIALNKLTLGPYPNLGAPRGFETDWYDGDWLLIGDPYRMIVARKVPASESAVTAATQDPDALKGLEGPLVGLWTVALSSQYSAELLFRPDGQFRLGRCSKGELLPDYGLYSVNLAERTLELDSRLADPVTVSMDFYANTMTLVSTNQGFPVTYVFDGARSAAALQASLAADADEAKLDALWLPRVPVGPRKAEAGEFPALPPDLQPGHVLQGATTFTSYRHYQQLIPSFVRLDPVVNSRDWHFLQNGRVMIRFIQYRGSSAGPLIEREVIDVWGAYSIEPKPDLTDILHLFADNVLRIETDRGEQLELTLENGRRHLFWDEARALLDEWAAERQPMSCLLPATNPNLMNTGISLRTTIPPDDLSGSAAIQLNLVRSLDGGFKVQGTSAGSATLILEHASSLGAAAQWQAVQTNRVPAGPFGLPISVSQESQGYYRARLP